MAHLKIHPTRRLNAELQVPGDKSISHRSVMLGGFADGETRITGFLSSEDCLASLSAMQAMGVEIETIDRTSYIVSGRGGKLRAPLEPLDCGNSGTTIRLLAGLVAGQPFTTRFFGDASLSRRPMRRIVEPLTLMGATLTCEGENMRPPLTVNGAALKPIHYQMPVASAQLKSAILLAGLQTPGLTVVEQPEVCRDHTERMLQHFGASIRLGGRRVEIYGDTTLNGKNLHVPGDFSSAAFWLVAAAALPGARLRLTKVGLNPTRTALLNVLMRMGAQIKENVECTDFEPYGTLRIEEGGKLRGTTVSGAEIPNLIDELPIIAVAGALADGQTVIKDARELRLKESDRIATVSRHLREFGVDVEEQPDGMIIHGGNPIRAAGVESRGDHRIAMAFAVLGLFADGESRIEDTACIKTSYPAFEAHLEQLMAGDIAGKFRIGAGLVSGVKRLVKPKTERMPAQNTKKRQK
ncbi:MAG: 3-phosphoshikimate 1-carboxyvinyltransferase [Verrucomicrobiales bacterium]|jgi:3-phosphoshikimate 1-carboxyvinyltransferase|nr:3-phosphoshikimate 1-carboxyvinyltransferase [Verrucomicrobiales bacterium]